MPVDAAVACSIQTRLPPATSEPVAGAEVLDADGKTVAIATGSAMVLPGRPASLGALED
jgi:hypothetical protein